MARALSRIGWHTGSALGMYYVSKPAQQQSREISSIILIQWDGFHAAQNKGDPDPRLYILYTALGEAVLRALGRQKIAPYVAPARLAGYPMTPTRSVVLIDEIDKAPRDFPNDVLRELKALLSRSTELGGAAIAAPTAMLPIVIITSNAERALPDASPLAGAFITICRFPTPRPWSALSMRGCRQSNHRRE